MEKERLSFMMMMKKKMRVACFKLMVLCCSKLWIATTHLRKQLWLLNSHHLQPHYHLSYHNLSLLSFSLKSNLSSLQLKFFCFFLFFVFFSLTIELIQSYSACNWIFFCFFFFFTIELIQLEIDFFFWFIFPRLGEIEPFQLAAEITLTHIHLWVSSCFSFLSRQRTWFCFSILWCNWVGPSPAKETWLNIWSQVKKDKNLLQVKKDSRKKRKNSLEFMLSSKQTHHSCCQQTHNPC
jgi:hypothetical protein